MFLEVELMVHRLRLAMSQVAETNEKLECSNALIAEKATALEEAIEDKDLFLSKVPSCLEL